MNTEGTLADKITGILNSAPTNFDPEDEDVDDTRAQTVSYFEENKSDNECSQKQELTKRRQFSYLMDTDERYLGKKKQP